MKYHPPRPAHRCIIRLLLTACVLASILTLAEAQTSPVDNFFPVYTLEVVDDDGDTVGVLYPSFSHSLHHSHLISEGFVPFFHRGYRQGVGRVLFYLRFTLQDGFWRNGEGYYEFENCAGSPLMPASYSTTFFVGRPGQTVYYHKPGLPVVTRIILSVRSNGICYNYNDSPKQLEVISPVPLMNLMGLFNPPFRIVARNSARLPH